MNTVDRLLNIATAVTCVAVAGFLWKGSVRSDSANSVGGLVSVDTVTQLSDDDWAKIVDASRPYSDTDGGVVIVTFMDMECPACADFHESLIALDSSRSGDVSIRLVHYPLPGHRFAIPAANAAECALAYNKFAEFVDAVFRKQRRVGVAKWSEFAKSAGIENDRVAAAIEMCADSDDIAPFVQSGMDLGRELAVSMTPTVIIAGQKWPRTPALGELIAAVDSINGGPEK